MTVTDLPERPPPFEFITLTERPAAQKSDFSYLVRSHAMQAVVHERRNPRLKKAISASQRTAETETKTSKELSGKFKLNTWKMKKRRKRNNPVHETVEQVFENAGDDAANFTQVSTSNQTSYKFSIATTRQASMLHYMLMEDYRYPHPVVVHNNYSIIVCTSSLVVTSTLTTLAQTTRASSRTRLQSTTMILGSLSALQTQHCCMQLYVWWPSTKILCAEWKTPPRICSTKEK
jgi:hypothetical protein